MKEQEKEEKANTKRARKAAQGKTVTCPGVNKFLNRPEFVMCGQLTDFFLVFESDNTREVYTRR